MVDASVLTQPCLVTGPMATCEAPVAWSAAIALYVASGLAKSLRADWQPRRAARGAGSAFGGSQHRRGGDHTRSQRQPSLSSHLIASPLASMPLVPWSAARQYSPGL